MRKYFPVICMILLLLSACGVNPANETTAPAGQVQLANPWKGYASIAEAEAASGLDFPLPDTIADVYTAEVFRVMNESLMEVTYKNGEIKITVRMQAGADLDISGVYENFQHTETTERNGAAITRKEATDCLVYLIHLNDYSFSIYATGLAADDACQEILSHIC